MGCGDAEVGPSRRDQRGVRVVDALTPHPVQRDRVGEGVNGVGVVPGHGVEHRRVRRVGLVVDHVHRLVDRRLGPLLRLDVLGARRGAARSGVRRLVPLDGRRVDALVRRLAGEGAGVGEDGRPRCHRRRPGGLRRVRDDEALAGADGALRATSHVDRVRDPGQRDVLPEVRVGDPDRAGHRPLRVLVRKGLQRDLVVEGRLAGLRVDVLPSRRHRLVEVPTVGAVVAVHDDLVDGEVLADARLDALRVLRDDRALVAEHLRDVVVGAALTGRALEGLLVGPGGRGALGGPGDGPRRVEGVLRVDDRDGLVRLLGHREGVLRLRLGGGRRSLRSGRRRRPGSAGSRPCSTWPWRCSSRPCCSGRRRGCRRSRSRSRHPGRRAGRSPGGRRRSRRRLHRGSRRSRPRWRASRPASPSSAGCSGCSA